MTIESGTAVVVTGANGGIGTAICEALNAKGIPVIATVRSAASEKIKSVSDHVVIMDLADINSIKRAASEIHLLTRGRLGGLVNNAGTAVLFPFENLVPELRDREINTNIVGFLELTRLVLPALRTAKGRIINLSSLAGRMPMPYNSIYSGIKHFVEGWSDSMRMELKPHGVKVAIVEPGMINTQMLDAAFGYSNEAKSKIGKKAVPIYDRYLQALLDGMDHGIHSGSHPSVVADAVLHALTSAAPKTRYPCGKHAKFSLALAQFLPDKLKDRLMLTMLGLTKVG